MDKPTIERGTRQARSMATEFTTRDDNNEKRIEGYFIVFNSNYDMGDGMSESVDPHALDDTISGDIRALINHDTTLVIGRTTARTLDLRIDAHGVWGSVLINPNDQDVMLRNVLSVSTFSTKNTPYPKVVTFIGRLKP